MRTRRPPTTVKSYACTCHVPSHTLAHTNVIECQHRWYLCLDVYGHVRRCQPTRTVPARIDVQTETHTHRITLLCMGLFFIIFRSIWLDIRYMYNIYIYGTLWSLWYQLKCQHDGPSIVQMWPACMVTPATNESPCCTPERGVMMCCINTFGWLRAKTSPSHINLYHLNSFDIYIYVYI